MSAFESNFCRLLVAVLLLAVSGCAEDPDDQPDLGCTLVEDGGATYCVHTDPITETGFICPDVTSFQHQQGQYVVCSDVEEVTPEKLYELLEGLIPGAGCITVGEPMADIDSDYLPNALEDTNRNCLRDAGETWWDVADTDGDKLPDGIEDVNQNGILELMRGEFDPLNPDTDADMIIDGDEHLAAVCNHTLLGELADGVVMSAGLSLALPGQWQIQQQDAASGATFGDSNAGVFGFIYDGTSVGALQQDLAAQLLAQTNAGHTPINLVQSAPFETWWYEGDPATPIDDVLPRTALTARLRFEYGANSPNPMQTGISAAALRDTLASAISGVGVDSGVTGPPCAALVGHHLVSVDDTGRLVSAILVACDDTLENDNAMFFFFEDFFSGSLIAPRVGNKAFRSNGIRCEEVLLSPDSVDAIDFLWVIDNSGSMVDEQANVARTASRFLETLQQSNTDWRLAVTTTEAYLLDDVMGQQPNDALLDRVSGLRGTGFIEADATMASAEFETLVTTSPGCVPPAAPPDANVCGWGLESGLDSAITVLDRMAADVRAGHASRSEAVRVVVWVTDEEDVNFKEADGQTPMPADDPRRESIQRGYEMALESRDVLACAIVGDVGTGEGGVCELLEDLEGVGAEYGVSYRGLAAASHGVAGTICSADLDVATDECIRRAVGRAYRFELPHYPISASMLVAVDGQRIPRSRTDGWNYEPTQNALTFYGTPVNGQTSVAVAYRTWELIVP